MAADAAAPRTKTEVERRSGLSHDAVARAFRQNGTQENRWRLALRFAELTNRPARYIDPEQAKLKDLGKKLADKTKQTTALKATLDQYAMAVLAQALELSQLPDPDSTVVPIGRNHNHETDD
ncbi:MAG: hypothetical protein ABIS86_05100 [Streptosporangiaceae bacterium]